ncbi:MAG: hypothetical protein IH592_03895 [Bacteroidales bacterium]|nr:hypothetical protein [Bacteroidales bacterium]
MNQTEKGWMTKTAGVLSVLFHPLFIPLYGLLIIYSSPTLLSFIPSRLKMLIFVLVMTNNVLLPLSLAAILWVRGAITTFNARDRNERVILLSFALMMYTLTAWLLLRMQVPNLFRAYFISIAVVTLITLLITTFYRLSLHAAGIGGLLVLIIFMVVIYDINTVWQLTTVVVVGGAVMSARIWLGYHTPSEVWTGLLAGAAVMALSLFILLK